MSIYMSMIRRENKTVGGVRMLVDILEMQAIDKSKMKKAMQQIKVQRNRTKNDVFLMHNLVHSYHYHLRRIHRGQRQMNNLQEDHPTMNPQRIEAAATLET